MGCGGSKGDNAAKGAEAAPQVAGATADPPDRASETGPPPTLTAAEEDEEKKKIAAQAGKKKRGGMSAESVSKEDAANYVKPVYPKDDSAKALIQDTLKNNEKMKVLFGHLDASQLADVVNAFQKKEVKQGEDVIRQGDEGDCLYIIDEGEVDIHVARPGPDGAMPADKGPKVVSFKKGSLFGELALMYTAPRAATVTVASAAASLWALDREPFKMLLMQSAEQHYAMYEGWLKEVDIFKTLNHLELSKLSEIMESTLFDTKEEIIKQGEGGDKFYILEDGECAAYIAGTDGEKEVKKYTKQGEYFGEIALLKDEPRKATVRATGEGCTVLSLSKEDFTNMLGPIADILKQHADQYPQYADILKS